MFRLDNQFSRVAFSTWPTLFYQSKAFLFALLNGTLGLAAFFFCFLFFCIIRLPTHKASPITFWPFFLVLLLSLLFRFVDVLVESEKWEIIFNVDEFIDSLLSVDLARIMLQKIWKRISSHRHYHHRPKRAFDPAWRVIGGKRAAHPVITHTRLSDTHKISGRRQQKKICG